MQRKNIYMMITRLKITTCGALDTSRTKPPEINSETAFSGKLVCVRGLCVKFVDNLCNLLFNLLKKEIAIFIYSRVYSIREQNFVNKNELQYELFSILYINLLTPEHSGKSC